MLLQGPSLKVKRAHRTLPQLAVQALANPSRAKGPPILSDFTFHDSILARLLPVAPRDRAHPDDVSPEGVCRPRAAERTGQLRAHHDRGLSPTGTWPSLHYREQNGMLKRPGTYSSSEPLPHPSCTSNRSPARADSPSRRASSDRSSTASLSNGKRCGTSS